MGKGIQKLLIVEDDKDILEIMFEYFSGFINEIKIAHDGKEGLEIYKSFSPDAVITDLTMPQMNGIDMSKEILNINSDQKIIICTANSEDYYKELAKQCGIQYVLTKPVDIALLVKYLGE